LGTITGWTNFAMRDNCLVSPASLSNWSSSFSEGYDASQRRSASRQLRLCMIQIRPSTNFRALLWQRVLSGIALEQK
jgi:hypothetical protein